MFLNKKWRKPMILWGYFLLSLKFVFYALGTEASLWRHLMTQHSRDTVLFNPEDDVAGDLV